MSRNPRAGLADEGAQAHLLPREKGTRTPPGQLSTRETSVEADFGRSFRVVAGPRLCTSPRVLASQGVSSLGEPASRRRSPFYGGSGDSPDELSSLFFLVGR